MSKEAENYRIGIDVGASNIRVGLVDSNYKIIDKISFKNDSSRFYDDIILDISKTTLAIIKEAELTMEDISCFGVGCSGTVDAEKGMVVNSGSPNFINVPFRALIAQKLGLCESRVFIDNDANAAAFAESIAGVCRDVDNSICVTIGTSIGSGVIIDGKIFRGAGNVGVDLGHTVVVFNGERCGCGRNGCWECYASAQALIHQTRRMMASHPESMLWKLADNDINNVDGKTAFEATRLGDIAGKGVVDQYVKYIACGLINIINSFQPAVLCIGGAVCNEGEVLIKPLIEYINEEQYVKGDVFKTKVCTAELKNSAGIIGAAFLDKQIF